MAKQCKTCSIGASDWWQFLRAFNVTEENLPAPLADLNQLPARDMRKAIDVLETFLLQMGESLDLPLTHRFAGGMYSRELLVPAGCLMTTVIHKVEHFVTISKGSIYVVDSFGNKQRINAPHTMVTKPGTKRAIFAFEDTAITTFHVTNETEVDKVEAAVIAKSYDEIPGLNFDKLILTEMPAPDLEQIERA